MGGPLIFSEALLFSKLDEASIALFDSLQYTICNEGNAKYREIIMNIPSKKRLKEEYKTRVVVGGVYQIHCHPTGERWLKASTNLEGAKNRFAFCVFTNSAPESGMSSAWKEHGASSFSFEALEELEKQELQTDQEFREDVNTLLTLWKEKQTEPR